MPCPVVNRVGLPHSIRQEVKIENRELRTRGMETEWLNKVQSRQQLEVQTPEAVHASDGNNFRINLPPLFYE